MIGVAAALRWVSRVLPATLRRGSRTKVFYWVCIFLFYIGFHVFIYLQYLQGVVKFRVM